MAHVLFLDESGQDHRDSPYEVLGGVAVEDSRIWSLILDIRQAEVEHFGCRVTADEMELKAKKLLKRKTFRQAALLPPYAPIDRTHLARAALDEGRNARSEGRPSKHTRAQLTALAQAKIAFCGRVLELCAQHQARTFASIVLPTAPTPKGTALRKDYAYLFERFFLFLEDVSRTEQGIVVFDELEKSRSHILINQMAEYFQKTAVGRLRASRVLPEPMFVHSELTSLIQVADLVVYIVSWGVRFKSMTAPVRPELQELVMAVRALRYRSLVENADGEFERWSFVFLDDLRPRSERDGCTK